MQTNAIKILPGDNRLTAFPISRPGIFEFYKDAARSYWTVDEVSLSKDIEDWSKLPCSYQHAIKFILAFFAASDKIVNINIARRFKKDVPILEVEYFYDFQIMIENVHAHMYSLLLDTVIPDAVERDRLLNAVTTIPVIKKMSEYMFRCIDSNESFARRILMMACVEGIFFTGCFCIIYWLSSKGLMPGLGHSNELIARDECLHATFALFLYDMIEVKLPQAEVHEIFREAVNIAGEFVEATLPEPMPEMNSRMMMPYVQCCADNLLTMINCEPLYKTKHDFHFMEQINLRNRTNFFERRVSEYGKPKSADRTQNEVVRDF